MPWVYAWRVKTDERDREVRLELSVLGRERVTVDGAVVSDGYSFRMKRRVPVPLGAGHSAGLEVSMTRLWPEVALSVDGRSVEPATKPRVPLWGWAFVLVCVGIFFVPPGQPDIARAALRGATAGLAMGLCIYSSAGLNAVVGLLACAVFAAGAWGLALTLH